MNLQPSEAQKKSGNYAKGHTHILGMRVSIENPAGSKRSGTDKDGQPWERELTHDYGYIRGTTGRDRDHLDVFIGPDATNAELPVVVIDQYDPDTGGFDEHKVMLGFEDQGDAMDAYHANYPDDWGGFGGVRQMPLVEFKKWAFGEGRRVKPSMELRRGGLVRWEQKYAAGGQVARDMSMSQLNPFGMDIGSGFSNAAIAGSAIADRAAQPARPPAPQAGVIDFTNEKLGDDVVGYFKDLQPSNTAYHEIDGRTLPTSYMKGADGKYYYGMSDITNLSGGGGEDGYTGIDAPFTNIQQVKDAGAFGGGRAWDSYAKANPYDKKFNMDGTFRDVTGNTKFASLGSDLASWALTVAALASGNPALAFAKSMGTKAAMGAIGTAMRPDGQPHPYGGVNKYQPSISAEPDRYARGGRVGALSLLR